MIKDTELRKGNFFVCQLEPDKEEILCQVIWFHKEGIENQFGGTCPYYASNPIHLTPEWLERCGFTSDKKQVWTIRIDEYSLLAIHKDGDYVFMDSMDGQCVESRDNKIMHVHQLQNLYFALTGEELTIKK